VAKVNYRRLQYFLAVVDAGTLTAAAEEMHIAQPALSRQIKTLERELKIALFETRGNRLVLTQAGHEFVAVARHLLVETRFAEEAVGYLRTGRVDTLMIAATAASIRGFLAPFIATTGPTDPAILTRTSSHFEIEDSLLHGVDCIVSPVPPSSGLAITRLGGIPLSAYVAVSHPWALQGRDEVTVHELCSNHLILPSRHSVSRRIFDEALSQACLSVDQISECEDGQTIIALAAAGHGIGLSTDQPLYDTHRLSVTVDDSNSPSRILQLQLHAAWLPGHFAAKTIQHLALRLRDFTRDLKITLAN
jgi:DNA-binding transcriptional LysR family regulator